ncbi:MAG TPA: DUF1080 domain-containing protein [Blastocatellia bacterium]|nr:DUF1080 domain-containing protein [Blastocatellia bacterium]
MTKRILALTMAGCALLAISCFSFEARSAQTNRPEGWKIHDLDRPQPAAVDPGTSNTEHQRARPPSDAVVLFAGKDLSQWRVGDGGPAKWRVANGYMEVVKGAGNISTRQGFGDCQVHVEWRAPVPAKGESQERGNSGVFLMGLYELQVLDSYKNNTYPDGQAAALYGQYPPLVNASRPPGQWQTYDIIFHRPRFDATGKLVQPARMTALHNGVLVQDNAELTGPTAHHERPPYKSHADKLPLSLQDHGDPVRYRNIWVRELPE